MNRHEKGRRWRKQVEDHLRGLGFHTTNRPLGEAGDDITATGHGIALSVEAKNHRAITLAAFVDQAVKQARAPFSIPVLFIKRPGRGSVGEGYVVMRVSEFGELLKGLVK